MSPPRRGPGGTTRPTRRAFHVALAVLVLATIGLAASRSIFSAGDTPAPDGGRPRAGTSVPPGDSVPPTTGRTPTSPPPVVTGPPGLTTFRGDAARNYFGEGPLPEDPHVVWRYPASGGMCSTSTNLGETKTWCGTGWTGQPNVIERKDGRLEVRFGAYDGRYHFLNGRTGEQIRKDLVTGDRAKGSATSDPDGWPLYYAGSRDNLLRIVALDRGPPTVLWSLDADAHPQARWNDDWDGAPLIVDDHMLVGGENSVFYVIKLNRHRGPKGYVKVDPEIVMSVPGYDDKLLAAIGDEDVSIESSVSFRDGVAYFANSGGLVQGWDISDILAGGDDYRRVFRFWNGNDTDATVVIDEEGYLYVARHGERSTTRDDEVGDLVKLDPRKPNRPVVWSVHVTGGSDAGGGLWATPAVHDGVVYVTTDYGELLAVGQDSGKILSKVRLPGPLWGSPVAVDGQVLVGDCSGVLHNFDVSDPRNPRKIWSVQLEGCIESTPAVWRGMIWVGTRGGPMYALGDG